MLDNILNWKCPICNGVIEIQYVSITCRSCGILLDPSTHRPLKINKMKEKGKKEIYGHAIANWGVVSQSNMCIEEMAELTRALLKGRRSIKSEHWIKDIHEELADVMIMIEQMIICFDGEEIVPKIIEKKLNWLSELLNEDDIRRGLKNGG